MGGNLIIYVALFIAFVSLIWLFREINNHYVRYLDGFWVHEGLDSKCILYISNNTLRVITIGEKVYNEKLDITFIPQTWFDLYLRRYGITTHSETKLIGKYSKILSKKGLYVDLYAIEGSIIIGDSSGDILTLVKDNNMTLDIVL